MPNNSRLFVSLASIASMALIASVASAQAVASCAGPGAAFGVTSYRCASCGVKQSPGARTQYVFEAEPVVLETTPASPLKGGDVVVAVNRLPIMTQAGSDAFTYPTTPTSTVTVRRGGLTTDVEATSLACRVDAPPTAALTTRGNPLTVVDGVVVPTLGGVPQSDIESVEVLKGALATGLYGPNAAAGVIVIKTKSGRPPANRAPEPAAAPSHEPLIVIDGVVQPQKAANSGTAARTTIGLLGFALECTGSCARGGVVAAGAPVRFETYPRVVELWPNGAAERAGMRIGDIVTQIDGKSILGKEGVQLMTGDGRANTMRVTVKREGSEVNLTVRPR